MVRGRILGHPIHLMLVHFPSGLYPFSFILDVIGLLTEKQHYHDVSLYALIGGVSTSIPASLFGAIDLLKIRNHHSAWGTAAKHAVLNVCLIIAFSVLLGVRLKSVGVTFISVCFMGLFNLGLVLSNYFGGELVLKYDLGKKNAS